MSSPKIARLVPQPDGSQPEEFVHISAFAFVRKGDQMLLVKRQKPERWAGKWCLPSALLLYGEDPAAGAKRTLSEQLGAAPTSLKLVDVQSYGDKHWDLCYVYQAEIPTVGKLGQDFVQADYFDVSKLPPELRDDHQEVVGLAKTRNVL